MIQMQTIRDYKGLPKLVHSIDWDKVNMCPKLSVPCFHLNKHSINYPTGSQPRARACACAIHAIALDQRAIKFR